MDFRLVLPDARPPERNFPEPHRDAIELETLYGLPGTRAQWSKTDFSFPTIDAIAAKTHLVLALQRP
jgi:hypothetical protein